MVSLRNTRDTVERERFGVNVRSERGASAVEFALISAVLFMVLFGTIQFGMAFHRAQGLEAAVREGARTASIGATQQDITSRVRNAQSLFTAADVAVTFDYSTNSGTSYTAIAASATNKPCQTAGLGNLVRVNATVAPAAKYAIAIPLWGNQTITYNAAGVFRCEKTQ